MKKEKLFEAIGQLDESLLSGADMQKPHRRVGWKVMLVAAVVAGMAVTAVASPTIRSALFGGKVETDDRTWFSATDPSDGSSYAMNSHEITLSVEMDEDAPESIQIYHIPQIPEGFTQIKGHLHGYDAPNALAQFWWILEGTDEDIFFSQVAGGSVTPQDLTEIVATVPGDKVQAEMCTIAEIRGYLIDVRPIGDGIGGDRIFFWSDGQYLFRLEVPYEYTDTQLEALVASVQPVEDIVPYLSTMTQQEIGGVFG